VIAVDRDLRVVVANSRASELLGGPIADGGPLPEPWSGFSLADLARGLFAPHAAVATTRLEHDADRVVVLTGLPAAASGADFGVLVVADVTERERRERAEREFVANAAHELRTPLTAIASTIEVLQQGAKDDPDERDRFLDAIERQTMRLERLVRALLTLARAQTQGGALRTEAVALGPLLEEIAEESGLGRESLDVEDGVVAIGHPDLIRQAVGNLIENARKHGEGAGLCVVGRRSGAAAAVIEVRDLGPGMSRDAAERVVDRFFRAGDRDADGFGLGLSIVREVVDAVGGTLEIETQPAAGTTVRLRLQSPENGR
jgi:signal transduction histidine kinase